MWPEYGGKAQQAKKKAPGFQNWMLEDDVRDEEKNPDYTFIIPAKVGLDEGNIKRWWASMKMLCPFLYPPCTRHALLTTELPPTNTNSSQLLPIAFTPSTTSIK